ncbi:MAG: YgjV family protein [Oscillospiraceae bacterium]|nr:YgjV family protein [Oscillospiraceae bacterium]
MDLMAFVTHALEPALEIPFVAGMTIEVWLTAPWIVSQVFAFIALIFMVSSFQAKKKLNVMLLLGFGTLFLAFSAWPLANYTLAILFLLASIRNYVFWFFDWQSQRGTISTRKFYYIFTIGFSIITLVYPFVLSQVYFSMVMRPEDYLGAPPASFVELWSQMEMWRIVFVCISLLALVISNLYFLLGDKKDAKKDSGSLKEVPRKIYYVFAVIFSTATIMSTTLLGHRGYAWWLEWLICATLVGLIIGNVLRGQNVMRLSFVANRCFNIINHVAFNNPIAVIIAAMAIFSNGVYYVRMLVNHLKGGESFQQDTSAAAKEKIDKE